jgi:DNA-binding IclR family transcriptional regulator
MKTWGLLTNHAHVLIQIARDPKSTVREIADAAGITERAAHTVLGDLREDGIVIATKDGRKNVYQIDAKKLVSAERWSAGGMEIPQSLIDATLRGLATVATNGSTL